MVEFKFKNIEDYFDWYTEECYCIIDNKYKNRFVKNMCKCMARGIFRGLKQNIHNEFIIISKEDNELIKYIEERKIRIEGEL
jgi:hypothetical protein